MPGLATAKILLKEHAFGVINVLKPGARIVESFAKNRVDGTGRRTKRVLQDKRLRMTFENGFGLQSVARHVSFGKWDFKVVAELPREVAVPLDFHRCTRRAENGHAKLEQLLRPWRLGPVDGHRDHQANGLLLHQLGRGGKLLW